MPRGVLLRRNGADAVIAVPSPLQSRGRGHGCAIRQHLKIDGRGGQTDAAGHLKPGKDRDRSGHRDGVLKPLNDLVGPRLPAREYIAWIGHGQQRDRAAGSHPDLLVRVVRDVSDIDHAGAVLAGHGILTTKEKQAQIELSGEHGGIFRNGWIRRDNHGIPHKNSAGKLPILENVLRPAEVLGGVENQQRMFAAAGPYGARRVVKDLAIHAETKAGRHRIDTRGRPQVLAGAGRREGREYHDYNRKWQKLPYKSFHGRTFLVPADALWGHGQHFVHARSIRANRRKYTANFGNAVLISYIDH